MLLTAATQIHDAGKTENVAKVGRKGENGEGGAEAWHAPTVHLEHNTTVTSRRPSIVSDHAEVEMGTRGSTNIPPTETFRF
jgi:hypothetical protein